MIVSYSLKITIKFKNCTKIIARVQLEKTARDNLPLHLIFNSA